MLDGPGRGRRAARARVRPCGSGSDFLRRSRARRPAAGCGWRSSAMSASSRPRPAAGWRCRPARGWWPCPPDPSMRPGATGWRSRAPMCSSSWAAPTVATARCCCTTPGCSGAPQLRRLRWSWPATPTSAAEAAALLAAGGAGRDRQRQRDPAHRRPAPGSCASGDPGAVHRARDRRQGAVPRAGGSPSSWSARPRTRSLAGIEVVAEVLAGRPGSQRGRHGPGHRRRHDGRLQRADVPTEDAPDQAVGTLWHGRYGRGRPGDALECPGRGRGGPLGAAVGCGTSTGTGSRQRRRDGRSGSGRAPGARSGPPPAGCWVPPGDRSAGGCRRAPTRPTCRGHLRPAACSARRRRGPRPVPRRHADRVRWRPAACAAGCRTGRRWTRC